MARNHLWTVRVSDEEARSFEASCRAAGVPRAVALRALVAAMSGGELSVIATDDGPQVVPGPNWAFKEAEV